MNRKIINVLLLLFVAFTLYNTLIPFNFETHGLSLNELLRQADWELFVHQGRRASLTDIAGNILLFLPLGFLLYLWGRQRGIKGILLVSGIVGFLLSVSIEFLQLFLVARNSSVTDILNNTAGTLAGTAGAFIYFSTVSNTANRHLRYLIGEQPLTLILVIIFVFQAVGAIIPFNVSITISDVQKSLKNINIIPFQNHSLSLLLLHRPMPIDSVPFDWYLFVENLLFWSVWGYISALCYAVYWQTRKNGLVLLLGVSFLAPLVLEILQIFIVSRYSDINDIISAWIGILAGLTVYGMYRPHLKYRNEELWRCLGGALILYTGFILFAGFQPFDFDFSSYGPISSIDHSAFVPFYSYFKKTSIWNIYDLINSLFYFMPVSFYLSHRWLHKGRNWPSIYLMTGLTGFLIGGSIELFQAFSYLRIAEITDALLYGLGGFLGTFLLYYFLREISPNIIVYEEPIPIE